MEMLDKEEYDRQMWEAEHPVNTTPEVIEENPAKDDNVISIDDTDDDIDGNLIGKSVGKCFSPLPKYVVYYLLVVKCMLMSFFFL